jgi:hypothetical protein
MGRPGVGRTESSSGGAPSWARMARSSEAEAPEPLTAMDWGPVDARPASASTGIRALLPDRRTTRAPRGKMLCITIGTRRHLAAATQKWVVHRRRNDSLIGGKGDANRLVEFLSRIDDGANLNAKTKGIQMQCAHNPLIRNHHHPQGSRPALALRRETLGHAISESNRWHKPT